MKTNASNPRQKELANKFIDALGDEADFFEGEVLFHEGGVMIVDEDGEVESYDSEEAFLQEYNAQGEAGEKDAAPSGAISGEGVSTEGREGKEATEEAPEENDDDPFGELLDSMGDTDEGSEAEEGEGAGELEIGEEPSDDPGDQGSGDAEESEGTDEAEEEDEGEGQGGGDQAEEQTEGSEGEEQEQDQDDAEDQNDGGDDGDDDMIDNELDQELTAIIEALTKDVTDQITGELDQNSARWRKGKRLVDLNHLKARMAKAGDTSLTRGNALIEYAQEIVDAELQRQGVVSDSDISREGTHTNWGSPSERSFTTKAFNTFMGDGGVDATFNLVDQIDPSTGEPLVADNGDPYQKPVSSIALNKAYRLAGLVDKKGTNRDRLLSFAWAYDEKSCVGLAKLVKEGYKLDKLLDDITAGRMTIEDEESANGGEIEVQWDSTKVKEYLTNKKANATGGVRSIKIDAALYEGDWTDIRRAATRLFTGLGKTDMLDERGDVRASKLLETIFDAVAPRNHGATVIADLFLSAGDITQRQRDQFVKFYSYGDNDSNDAEFNPDAEVGDVTAEDIDLD